MSVHGDSDNEFVNDFCDDPVTLISRLDMSDPLHLHPNDYTALTVVSIKLKGTENDQVWSCAMLLPFEGKNKTSFIDGSCKRSNTDEVLERQWNKVNTVVLDWILNSISEELFMGQIFSKRAKHVWEGLKETYDKLDGSITFEVLPDVRSAYATIFSEESCRVASGSIAGSSQRNQAYAFVYNVSNRGNFQRTSQSDSSHSSVSGGGVDTADFSRNNFRNDTDSSDGIFAAHDEHVTTLEDNAMSEGDLD
uniref:Ribonuclease H-like domain-containing protein n=1 Tax=Tanacetum cinerariifolium TaxID=118510 RepID=A0A6L2MKN7_TANCI|nr:ribonuclease H-like domain-containing protein [Tanacetum cinerariifolium]